MNRFFLVKEVEHNRERRARSVCLRLLSTLTSIVTNKAKGLIQVDPIQCSQEDCLCTVTRDIIVIVHEQTFLRWYSDIFIESPTPKRVASTSLLFVEAVCAEKVRYFRKYYRSRQQTWSISRTWSHHRDYTPMWDCMRLFNEMTMNVPAEPGKTKYHIKRGTQASATQKLTGYRNHISHLFSGYKAKQETASISLVT